MHVAAAHVAAAVLATLSIALTPSAVQPDPVLRYEGVVTATDNGEGVGSSVTATVDCSSDPCTFTGILAVGGGREVDLTGQGPVPFNGTSQSYDAPATGDVCSGTYVSTGQLTVTRVNDTLEITRTGEGLDDPDCGLSAIRVPPFVVEILVTLASGDLCVLDGSCLLPSDEPVPAVPEASEVAGDEEIIPGAPSTLSTLATVAEAINPLNLLWAVGAATVLILLVALPSQLVNTAVERIGERGGRRLSRLPLTGWPIAAGGVLAAAVVSTFIEPDAVFDLRVFASVLIAFLLDAVLGWFVVIRLVRRFDPEAKPTFRLLPLMLMLVVVAVLFSRLTGFQPGLMFGLVAGVVFGGLVGLLSRARVVLLELGWAFGLAVLAWIGYSLVEPDVVFLRETLAAIAIGGIAALPVALMPVPGLAGRTVWEWSKPVWAGAYALGLVGFLLVLMPRPFSWEEVGLSIWVWGAIFAGYAIAAVVLWLVVTKPWVRAPAAESAAETTD